jgi:sugar transferase (PEP-CTERM/EpsH1 system associated)
MRPQDPEDDLPPFSGTREQKLRILYIAHRIPYPPNKGEKIRCFHQLQFLSERHSIDLFCFADSAREAEGRVELERFCRRVHVEVLTPKAGYLRMVRKGLVDRPASVNYYDSPSMHEAVRQAIRSRKFDLIFVYCSSMAQFVPSNVAIPTAIDFVDADSAKWAQYARYSSFPMSWLYARESASLAKYEKAATDRCGVSIVTTAQDAADLGGGSCSAVVIPNGVSAQPKIETRDLPEHIRDMQPYVLFLGTMSYRPNVDAVVYFVTEIFPQLRKERPEVRFLIVGRDPTSDVLKLARYPGVVVTGSVPEVHAYVSGAAVAVSPFRIAQGVQNKILEALVAGVPVVAASRPARAISGLAKEVLLVADAPRDFGDAILSVLENPDLRLRSQKAVPALRDSLAWEGILVKLEALLVNLAGASTEAHPEVISHA